MSTQTHPMTYQPLPKFHVIAAVDKYGGIARQGQIPWHKPKDVQFFHTTTIGERKNAVIMGRKTWEAIPEKHRPLRDRLNIILTRNMTISLSPQHNTSIQTASSFVEALYKARICKDVYICGGSHIYQESLTEFLPLCKSVIITHIDEDYHCDQFFPLELISTFPSISEPLDSHDTSMIVRRYNPNAGRENIKKISLFLKCNKNCELVDVSEKELQTIPREDTILSFTSMQNCPTQQGQNYNYWLIADASLLQEAALFDQITHITMLLDDNKKKKEKEKEKKREGEREEKEKVQIPLEFELQPNSTATVLYYKRNNCSPALNHEKQYLELMRHILQTGKLRIDRTGVGTIGLFGYQQRWDISTHLPLLTTRFIPIKTIIEELLWFLRGNTNSKELEKKGVTIWKGNSSRTFLDRTGLVNYEEGDLGPIYGFQWRHFGATYTGYDKTGHDYQGQGVDQISYVFDLLKRDPYSRRIILTSWNPSVLKQVALPACHTLFQFYLEDGKEKDEKYLSGHLYMRSQDYFLAANFNLVSYTILLYIFAKKLGYHPKEIVVSWSDLHIYQNHVKQCEEQLQRKPRPQPILRLSDQIITKTWEQIELADFELLGYLPWPAIKADMAV